MTMVHRSGVPAEDPRMRAYWKWHAPGQAHRVPREGARPDHLFVCSWCDSTQHGWEFIPDSVSLYPDGSRSGKSRRTYDDREVEKFNLPQAAADNPMAWIAGRLG